MPTAIKFENISKQYRLGLVSTKTLSHDLNRWWTTNIRGKEDPYLKIGEVNDRAHKGESDYVWALKDIDFEVQQGDVLGIIGKNGAGKSTLLKILSKVTAPTTGTIRAAGRIASLLEVGTGFHPEMTGRENIYMNGAIMGMTKREIASKLDEIVDFSGVERYIDTPAKRYSSGMTVRLGFAIAAHLEPEILVVDEVLAVGDAEFQKKAIGKMQDVSKSDGRTVLFVSHNMAAVKSLCTKGIILQNGGIIHQGKIDEAVDKYLSVDFVDNKTIQSSIGYLNQDIQIQNISINGTTKNQLFLRNDENVLDIFIEGQLNKEMKIAIELEIRDINENLVAFYSPGHQYGELNKHSKGKFSINEKILLPDNLNKGELFLSLFLTHPNMEYWMKATHCLKIETQGVANEMGVELLFKDRGYLFLNRVN